MSYALRISHYILEKDPAVEYFIPFTKKALVSLLDGDYVDAIGEIFSFKKEELKELLEKSEGTLDKFLYRHNLYDLKDENGENYFVELLDKDNQGDVWIINNPEEPEENSLGDYLADAKLISDTVDSVGFLEFSRNIEGSRLLSDINEEAENSMMFRLQFFLEKVIFSIIVAIDESGDRNTIEWPIPPKDFCNYINSFFTDIKNNSDGENVVQSLDEIFEVAENSFSEKIVDIEQFTEFFLRLEIPNISYSLYAASYDYIYNIFEILIGHRKDLFTNELVEYIDKIHINLWEASRHKPFSLIKLMNIRVGTDIIIKDLLNANWSTFFIKILPKGIKEFENIKDLFEKPKDWWPSEISNSTYSKVVKKYSRDEKGCFVIAIMDNKNYFSLSGFDYDGKILKGDKLKSSTKRYKKTMNIVEKNCIREKAVHCNLNDLTKRYTKIVDKINMNNIEYIEPYSYLKDDLKNDFNADIKNPYEWNANTKSKDVDYESTFACCERKILGKILPEGQESCEQKIVFFSRWAPCEKCRPAIYLQQNSDYYAYADKYEEGVKYNLSKYHVKKNLNGKKYEIIKEELNKDIDSSSKIRPQENDYAADNNVQLHKSDLDIKIYDDQYKIFNIYESYCKGKEFKLEYSIQIKSYLLKPKYRYIQIGIDEEEGISIFCDKEEGKAYVGFKYAFLSELKIKNVYEGDIYYWGEKSAQDFLKKDLSCYFLKEFPKKEFGNIVEIDVTNIKGVLIFCKYDKPRLAILRQNLEQNKDRISDIVINSSFEDIDISMCKYGMKSLSEVKSISLCCNGNKDNIVKLTKVCKKIIEACKVDKLLKKIEEEKQPGSKIEVEKKKLRDSMEEALKNLNDGSSVFEDITICII